MTSFSNVAVIIPCLNEEQAIGHVVRSISLSLPGAMVYVYDNGSSDETMSVAAEAGAIVRAEPTRGKGNVVRRMFADVDADVYVMLDGDGTYDPSAAPSLVKKLQLEKLDLVTGVRVSNVSTHSSYRRGHRFGNAIFTRLLKIAFRSDCADVLSGYRVMSRRFVKSFPSAARGFEIEVEMTAHASLLRVPAGEVETFYGNRTEGTASKLRTYRDGLRIGRALFRIFRAYAPSRFFGTLAGLSGCFTGVFAVLALADDSIGLSAYTIASGVSFVIAALLFSVGVILNALARQRIEVLRLAYLGLRT